MIGGLRRLLLPIRLASLAVLRGLLRWAELVLCVVVILWERLVLMLGLRGLLLRVHGMGLSLIGLRVLR